MRRFWLLLVLVFPVVLVAQDSTVVDTVVVAADTIPVPPVAIPGSPGEFINQYFNQIILLLSAGIMWLLVKFAPGFDVAKDLVKYGVYGTSLLVTYVLARYLGGTVPGGLSDMLATFLDGVFPMLMTALGGVSLYNLSVSQRKMVKAARDPLNPGA